MRMDDTFRDPDAKRRQIEVCLTGTVEYQRTTGFERFDFLNEALPEVSLAALDLSATLAGKPLRASLVIAPMTGGTARGEAINCQLAAAAERFGLSFGVGSQRMAPESPERATHFRVRSVAPSIPVARPFLLAAHMDGQAVERLVQQVLDELRICMFAVGSANVAGLRGKLRLRPAAFAA